MCQKEQFVTGVTEQYPEELLENRLTIEGNLIACLYADVTLYDDICSNINVESFLSRHGKLLFGVVKYLREKKFNVIDEVTVLSNCPEEVLDRLQSIGGWKTIQKLASTVDLKNWDAILDEFNKSNIILKLHKNGFNLLEEVTLDNGKKIKPLKLFEKFSANNVTEWYEERIANISINNSASSTKIISEGYMLFGDNFLDELKEEGDDGISLADAGTNFEGKEIPMFPFLSRQISGLHRGTTTALASHSGCGKTNLIMNIAFALVQKGLKGVFISNEMSEKELKIIMTIIILVQYRNYWKVTKNKLRNRDMTQEDEEEVRAALKWWDNGPGKNFKVISMTDADSALTHDIIKKEALRNGIDFYVVDTFKMTLEDGNNSGFWIDLIKDARDMDSLAKKFNLVGLFTIQLVANSIGNLFLDASALSGSKAIKETCSTMLFLRKAVLNLELEAGGPYDFKPFRSIKQPDGSYKDQPYELTDKEKASTFRVLTVDKNRYGADSGDNGVAYLYKYTGDFCKWGETCKVRPVRKRIGQDTNTK
jgi:replicative DNA helicase